MTTILHNAAANPLAAWIFLLVTAIFIRCCYEWVPLRHATLILLTVAAVLGVGFAYGWSVMVLFTGV